MLFNSFEFLVFFPIVTFLFFALPHKYRWFHLLVASCIFYMYFIPIYILILFATIIIDYFAGIMIEKAEGAKRKSYLIVSLVANIGVLAVFKYYNFFIDNINAAGASLPYLDIILPIGLSFHTFQAMSYTIEVYRRKFPAEKHFGIYALYVMFYPQLVAGPIERPQNILPQFHQKQAFDYNNVVSGLRLMVWGLIKKVVIADRLALFTDPVFGNPGDFPGTTIFIAAIFFAFQIFCDFSGYSDIALGSARVMGFKLMTNFNKPYRARSISEFWKRWHISLSTWFKDYLYIPLGGNRVAIPRAYFNLFFVFLVSGLWHGANWTFIIWGALHGFYLVFALITKNIREKLATGIGLNKLPRLNNTIDNAIVFILVTLGWVFFRAENVSDAVFMLKKIGQVPAEILSARNLDFLNLPLSKTEVALAIMLILGLEFAHSVQLKYDEFIYKKPPVLRWSLYFMGVMLILLLGVFEKTSFIYFQF